MIEGFRIAFRQRLSFPLVNELVELALVLGLSERNHAATLPSGGD
jgi:hypothetical protein